MTVLIIGGEIRDKESLQAFENDREVTSQTNSLQITTIIITLHRIACNHSRCRFTIP